MINDGAPGAALGQLLKILDLEQLEVNLFRGSSPANGWQRVFGGQVLAQSLVAAVRTVEETRPVHSLHGYFLLGGDPSHPIIYEIERTRDGGSFTTRRVKAIQHGRIIFTMSASFHKAEDGYEHQAEMPDVPAPETLPDAAQVIREFKDQLPDALRLAWSRPQPVDLRPVEFSRYLRREPGPARQNIWLRANGDLGANALLHASVLAYASDFTLLDTALIPHGKLLFDPDVQMASLDHAMWFHRSFRADDWLLYSQDSPNSGGARGFCRGSVFTRDGRLIASVAQEGLVRKRQSMTLIK